VAPEHIGWQMTSRWIGILFLAIAWPLSQLIRNRPEDYGLVPDGESSSRNLSDRLKGVGPVPETGLTAREAVRTKAFWLLAIGTGLASMSLATLAVHMVPSLIDHGLTLQTASFVWATMLGTSWVAQLVSGYLGDKVEKNVAMALLSWVQAIGLCLAAFTVNLPVAFMFAIVYGIGFGGRIPISTAIRGEYFGRRAFGTIMGLSSLPMAGFSVMGPTLSGAVFDAQQSYFLAFIALAISAVLAGVFMLLAKKPMLPA